MKHTKGPWAPERDKGYPGNKGGGWKVWAEDERICTVTDGIFSHANSNLIAAAPDLLEALQMFVKEYKGNGHDDREQRPEMMAARRAIAKAKGLTE